MKLTGLSIKTRFVTLLSILMAMVLAIQFYFTAQTQDDVLEELTRLSSSMKKATDVHFYRGIPPAPYIASGHNAMIYKKPDENMQTKSVLQIFKENGAMVIDSVNDFPLIVKAEDDQDYNILVKKIKHWKPDTLRIKSSGFKREIKSHYTFNDDSLSWVVEEVEVSLEHPQETMRSKSSGTKGVAKMLTKVIGTGKAAPSFEFVIPDFTKPDNPRLMRFNYNAAVIQDMMEDIRDRNILITLSLFVLSISVIIAMTRKFLKPIDHLQYSFNEVVEGNLDVNVQSEAKDEIGDLTRSFNHMVLELKKNKEKEVLLQRKERLASLGQLAAGVAHEVKNPLNAINLTIDHLNDKFVDQKDRQAVKYINTIQSEIKRLDKIVNNFFNYLRSEELDLSDVDINIVLNDVISLFERELEAGKIDLQMEVAGKFTMRVDEARIKTALMNVVLNAIQAMEDGGALKIKTINKLKTIEISDTGRGIESKEADHIFDLFYTTKSTGTGLGLPTAYKIIKAHNGEINLRSKPGKGTIVTIQL